MDNLIIHFTGRNKPWQMVLDKQAELWRHYLDLSVWEGIADPNPPKDPSHYFNWKSMMVFNRKRGKYASMLYCLYWYAVLKIRFILNGREE